MVILGGLGAAAGGMQGGAQGAPRPRRRRSSQGPQPLQPQQRQLLLLGPGQHELAHQRPQRQRQVNRGGLQQAAGQEIVWQSGSETPARDHLTSPNVAPAALAGTGTASPSSN
jgi:hypothetical protein